MTPPHATLEQPDGSADAAETADSTDFDAAPADAPAAPEEGSSDGSASGDAGKAAADPQGEGATDGHGGKAPEPSHTARITREVFAAAQKATAKAAAASADAKAAPSGYTRPADACAITVSGGTEGIDYYYENVRYTRKSAHPTKTHTHSDDLKKLVICTDRPLTLSTNGVVDGTIWIEPGTAANLTFNGIQLTSNIPVHIERNRDADGNTVSPETSLHITLADKSKNVILANKDGYSAGIHCGKGTSLTIDDQVKNVDTSGNPIVPENGMIPAGTTFVDKAGKTRTATATDSNALDLLASTEPGSLEVTSGYKGAGIGSVSFEDAGAMTFNGGIITAKGFNNPSIPVTNTSSENWFHGVGAGIGSGEGSSPTYITINGGEVDATGAYHGAAIGGSLAAWYDGSHNPAWFGRESSFLFEDSLYSGKVENSSNTMSDATMGNAGHIRINGGLVRATAPYHGNAIGKGCASWNKGGSIIITGGTVLPDSTNSAGFKDIGGNAGYVVITGGSISTDESGSKFENMAGNGYAFGSFSYDEDNALVVDPSEDNKVFMITIDLGSEIEKRNQDNGITDSTLDEAIDSWSLTVGGKDYPYGAPARFNNGKLFLWLPKSATEKEITVNLSYTDKKGDEQKIEPLFRDPNTTQNGTTLKRYISFELPDSFKNLWKYYDGTPLPGLSIDPDNTLPTEDGKELSKPDQISYKYQLYSDDRQTPLSIESASATEMPSNVGTMKITVDSAEHAVKGSAFATSYWGHRATGWCEIKPIPSSVEIVEADWINGDKGTVMNPSSMELKVTARINRGPYDPAGNPTKDTCKAPEGRVQLYMDYKKVGDPIELLFEDKPAASSASLFSDPVRAAARTVTLPGQKNAERVPSDPSVGGYTLFTYVFKPSDADFLVPLATSNNEHIVSLQYLPPDEDSDAPRNYLESINPADHPKEAPQAPVVIEPIDPNPTVSSEPDPENKDPQASTPTVKTDPNPTPTDPSADPNKPCDKTYGGTIETTWDKPSEANPHPGRVTLKVKTPSTGAISVIGEGGELYEATFLCGDDKQPIRNDDGTYTLVLDPQKVGTGKLTLSQKPNGAYTGTTWVFDVNVKPNPKIAPEPSLTKRAENLTHPAGPTQPGDRIRYTVEAGNSATGSVWTQVVASDPLPGCLELDEGTLRLANERDGRAEAALEKAASVAASDVGKFSLAERDGKQVLTVPVGAVYGGATARVTFECTVKGDIDFATATAADLDLANIASASGKRLNPDDPDGDDVDLDPQPNPEPGRGPEPTTPPVTPPGGGKVVPLDPGDSNLAFSKAVENLTRPTEKVTKIGDKLRYTVLLENKGPANSVLWDAVVSDPLPQGMEPVAGSIKMALSDGTERSVDDSAYDKASRTLAVACGDLWGGTSAQLTFECTVGADAVGADNGNVALYFAKKPSEDPGHDPTDPGREPGTPATPPAGEQPKGQTPAATPPTLLPDDPAAGDVKVSKAAENLTSKDGKTRVGDEVRYTIVLRNDGDGTAWMDAVIRDDVPRGLEPVSGSIEMTLSDGTAIDVSDDAYNDQTRRLSVSAGRLYGGRQVTLAFTALVTEDAVGSDVGNVAVALGKLPSKWDPEGDHPEAGQPFDPPAGWEAWERESERVSSEPAYPPGADVDGGVLPRTEGDENSGKDGKDKTIAGKRLAQTGDDMARAATALGVLALASAAALLLARRSRRAR